jgi:CheY-like chemotaxis protein
MGPEPQAFAPTRRGSADADLARQLAAVQESARDLAHEFNNLLTAIVGYANLLDRSFPADDPRRGDTQEIVQAAQSAADLARQLLSLGRPADAAESAATEEEARTEGTPAASDAAATAPRVLVVEDERAVRYLVRTILSRQGYEVVEMGDPGEAERWLATAANAVDLLITDIMMPGASGPDLYGRARQARPALRVLYMSGYSDEAMAGEWGTGAGAAFIQKPFTAEELTQKVRETLEA